MCYTGTDCDTIANVDLWRAVKKFSFRAVSVETNTNFRHSARLQPRTSSALLCESVISPTMSSKKGGIRFQVTDEIEPVNSSTAAIHHPGDHGTQPNHENENLDLNHVYDRNPDNHDLKTTFVIRNGKQYEKRLAGYEEDPKSIPDLLKEKTALLRTRAAASRAFVSMKSFIGIIGEDAPPPDAHFCASTYMKLSKGITAYRLIEPALATDEMIQKLPLVVCLHGMTTSSYIFGDLADLMMNNDHGPSCRVLVFDFYGHGRSPWSGVTCSLDLYVSQTKELLEGSFSFVCLCCCFL